MLFEHDPRWSILIPLSGAADDQAIGSTILTSNFSPRVESVQLGLDDLTRALEGSLCYVGNDTGIKHVCLALGMPTVTLFGPDEPSEWHPYDTALHPVFFEQDVSCRYRDNYYCSLSDCKSMLCLNQFSPHMVLKEVLACCGRPA